MAPLYKKALVVGATSGIWAALASQLIANDTKVVVAFANEIIQSNPNLDCVPETVDLPVLGDELMTNYTSAVHLTASFLPRIKKEPHGNLVYISATLGLIPAMIRTPNYNASKAALHTFIMNVRQQLREAGYSNVRIVEVFPPAVQTELHDEKHQPDLVNGGEIGMPLAEFTDQMYAGLVKGSDQFAIGLGEDLFKEGGWEYQRGQMYEAAQDYFKDALAPYLKK
ncbi:hypothetical protein EDB80DRAFT_749594 [Ilyonectria destructans]|nr:hypothetical protein EDB80DRAFT_749594 [Ilyonectria destructans]